jgi:hypothetical protein
MKLPFVIARVPACGTASVAESRMAVLSKAVLSKVVLSVAVFAALSTSASGQLTRPQLGTMVDRGGNARPVYGAAASASLGDPVFSGVVSLACSNWCLVKTESALVSSGGTSVDAPAGAALIALRDSWEGAGAYVYFLETKQLAFWHGGEIEFLPFAPEGSVLSIRATSYGMDYALRQSDAVWIGAQRVDNGNSLLLIDGGVVIATQDRVRIVRAHGSEVDFPLAGVQGLIAMGNGYVQLLGPAGSWVLATEPGNEKIFALPDDVPAPLADEARQGAVAPQQTAGPNPESAP